MCKNEYCLCKVTKYIYNIDPYNTTLKLAKYTLNIGLYCTIYLIRESGKIITKNIKNLVGDPSK